MEQQWFDVKSILGTVFSFVMAGIGIFTLNEWATIGAIGAGVSTTLYTCIKIWKEFKTKK
jgi:hypothetical protein